MSATALAVPWLTQHARRIMADETKQAAGPSTNLPNRLTDVLVKLRKEPK